MKGKLTFIICLIMQLGLYPEVLRFYTMGHKDYINFPLFHIWGGPPLPPPPLASGGTASLFLLRLTVNTGLFLHAPSTHLRPA